MAQTFYRIQPAGRDAADLLKPGQRSRLWSGPALRRCEACAGYGDVDGDRCQACAGMGEIEEDGRRGVSCCRTLEDLADYFRPRQADLDGVALVELEGDLSEDEDWDADAGAVLVNPTRIVAVMPDSAWSDAFRSLLTASGWY